MLDLRACKIHKSISTTYSNSLNNLARPQYDDLIAHLLTTTRILTRIT
jgi:hypothetical protein